jgi:hypothetical protein
MVAIAALPLVGALGAGAALSLLPLERRGVAELLWMSGAVGAGLSVVTFAAISLTAMARRRRATRSDNIAPVAVTPAEPDPLFDESEKRARPARPGKGLDLWIDDGHATASRHDDHAASTAPDPGEDRAPRVRSEDLLGWPMPAWTRGAG